jgi:hypothetical protein
MSNTVNTLLYSYLIRSVRLNECNGLLARLDTSPSPIEAELGYDHRCDGETGGWYFEASVLRVMLYP